MDKNQSVTLFQLGGDEPWSNPITVNPDHVSSIEPYKRVGKVPTVPRCTVSMLNGTTHRVLGESDHVLEWLGWDICPTADAYKKFMALRNADGATGDPKPSTNKSRPVPKPAASAVPKPATGDSVGSGIEGL